MIRKIPYLITLLGMIGGVGIAILFGINEGIFKDRIQEGLKKNEAISAITDENAREAKIKKEASKNWRYYQRFHFHSTGIGAMALAILLLLNFCHAPCRHKIVTSYMISVGGFFYPFVWLFAAIYGPQWGRDVAKESFALFSYMGGLFWLGTLATFYLLVRYPLKFPKLNS